MLFKAEFDAMGFNTERQDGAAFGRAGHLETVFAKDDVFQAFSPLDHRYIAGPGQPGFVKDVPPGERRSWLQPCGGC